MSTARKHRKIKAAVKLYEDFSGHRPRFIERVSLPIPEVLMLVGECDGVLYSCVRDGKPEKYIHRFNKSARPLLTSNETGTQLYLIGGQYSFTSRGIVDRRPKS